MFSAAARASKLLRTHSAIMPDATRLYRARLPRLSRPSPRYLPPTPTPPPSPCAPRAPASAARTIALVGASSGALGAMCGVGGAIFSIPALVRFAHLSQRHAAANSLVAVTCVAVTGAASLASASQHAVDCTTAACLSAGAMLFSPLGANASARLNAPALRTALGAFMLVLAPIMPLRAYLQRRASAQPVSSERERPLLLTSVGAAIGFTSGLLGISGGSLFTPVIALLSPEQSFKQVLATSFATMVLPTACGALSYARMGLVSAAVVPPLLVGAVCGAALGSNVALVVPDSVLQTTFAAVFTLMGLRIVRAPIVAPSRASKLVRAAAAAAPS